MCQCHTMWQSEGAMQVQVAHNKKNSSWGKKFLLGVPGVFSGGTPGGGRGYEKKVRANPPPPDYHGTCVRIPMHEECEGPCSIDCVRK